MAREKDYGIWEDSRKPEAYLLDNGKWECVAQADLKYPKPDGKPKRFKRGGDTKEEAQRKAWTARNKYEYECKLSVQKDKTDTKTKTLGKYMEEWLENEKKKELGGSTFKVYKQVLNYAFYKRNISKMQLNMIKLADVENYLDGIQKDYSYSVLNNMRVLFNGLFFSLKKKNLIEINFMEFAKTKKEIQDEYLREKEENKPEEKTKEYLTDEDIKILYDNMKKYGNTYKYYACYLLQLETFIRSEELFAIRLTDIDKTNRILHIKSAIGIREAPKGSKNKYEQYEKVPKGRKSRDIYLSDFALEAIEQLERQLELFCKTNPDNLLICNYRNGKFVSLSSYEYLWIDACARMGIVRPKGFGPHKLRHTGITTIATRGDNKKDNIMLQAGHEDERTQMLYIHQGKENIQEINTPLNIINKTNEDKKMSDEEKELYDMYLKLKDKFEIKENPSN